MREIKIERCENHKQHHQKSPMRKNIEEQLKFQKDRKMLLIFWLKHITKLAGRRYTSETIEIRSYKD